MKETVKYHSHSPKGTQNTFPVIENGFLIPKFCEMRPGLEFKDVNLSSSSNIYEIRGLENSYSISYLKSWRLKKPIEKMSWGLNEIINIKGTGKLNCECTSLPLPSLCENHWHRANPDILFSICKLICMCTASFNTITYSIAK